MRVPSATFVAAALLAGLLVGAATATAAPSPYEVSGTRSP